MRYCTLLLLGYLAITACSKSPLDHRNECRVDVRKTTVQMGDRNGVLTRIYTPYLQEETRTSEDGTFNLRFLTATIHDNDDEHFSQTLIFEGDILREVSMVRHNKRTKTKSETKYAPDGSFIMQRINQDPWSNQDGEPISQTQKINALKILQNKSIDLRTIEVQPKK
jgi:hypothetical protein